MSEEKIATHPSGKEIIFREEEHTYTCEGIQYTSVTTLIHACFPEFDVKILF